MLDNIEIEKKNHHKTPIFWEIDIERVLASNKIW